MGRLIASMVSMFPSERGGNETKEVNLSEENKQIVRTEEVPIPKEWENHFNAETLMDLWVYMNYGNKSPDEALRILGLEKPPAPVMVAAVDISQTTPEQNEKKDIQKKEATKMSEAKEKAEMTYPSTEGQGFEPI